MAGKIFATLPPDCGRLHVFLDDDHITASCPEFPDAVEELWWGALLTESWCRRGPEKVRALLER